MLKAHAAGIRDAAITARCPRGVVSSAGDDDRAWLIGRIIVPGKPVSSRIPAKDAVPLP